MLHKQQSRFCRCTTNLSSDTASFSLFPLVAFQTNDNTALALHTNTSTNGHISQFRCGGRSNGQRRGRGGIGGDAGGTTDDGGDELAAAPTPSTAQIPRSHSISAPISRSGGDRVAAGDMRCGRETGGGGRARRRHGARGTSLRIGVHRATGCDGGECTRSCARRLTHHSPLTIIVLSRAIMQRDHPEERTLSLL